MYKKKKNEAEITWTLAFEFGAVKIRKIIKHCGQRYLL